jgi:hypothetical protein
MKPFMKPIEKQIMLAIFTAAWIGLWMTGPEDPGAEYETWHFVLFAVVLIGCFIQAVRFWSQHIQYRDAERLKKVLKRRDARPNQ